MATLGLEATVVGVLIVLLGFGCITLMTGKTTTDLKYMKVGFLLMALGAIVCAFGIVSLDNLSQ